MRIADRTILTKDEQWSIPRETAQLVKQMLDSLKLDSYNNQYVIRITVDAVDQEGPQDDDDGPK